MSDMMQALDGIASFISTSEVHGFRVKEWSIVQFHKLQPIILKVVKDLISKGYTKDNVMDKIQENPQELLEAAGPYILEIILISCPGKTPNDLEELSFVHGAELLFAIIRANIMHVTDFFGEKLAIMRAISEKAQSETSTLPKTNSQPA